MSKIIVTLIDPIFDGEKYSENFSFDYMATTNCEGILWFKSEGECEPCAIPISNIRGVAYKQDAEPTKNTEE